ncbi:MAG: hypothetical protein KKG12_08785 [Gammaproteobacteria bacterium]|nr:hypothetical protein [Gammaproteobacteria bacterium]
MVKALEQPDDGFVACSLPPVEQTHQRCVQAGDVCVGKAGRATPDADDHLLDQLLWAVTTVGAGLGKVPALKGFFETHAVEHAFQQGQSTPGGDFTRGELQIEGSLGVHGRSKSGQDR